MGNSFSQPTSNGGGVKNVLRRKLAAISYCRKVDQLGIEKPSSIYTFKQMRLTKKQEQLLRIYFERKEATVTEIPHARKEEKLRIEAAANEGKEECSNLKVDENEDNLEGVIADILGESQEVTNFKREDALRFIQRKVRKENTHLVEKSNENFDAVIAAILEENPDEMEMEIKIKDIECYEKAIEKEKRKTTIDDVIADIFDETSGDFAAQNVTSNSHLEKTVAREFLSKCNKDTINAKYKDLGWNMSGDVRILEEIKKQNDVDKEYTKCVAEAECQLESTRGESVWYQNAARLKRIRNEAQSKSSASEVVKPGCRKDGQTKTDCVHFSRTMAKTKTGTSVLELLKKAKPRRCPDKGIRWPSVTDGLSRETLAYYVENFLCSQLFKTRASRMVTGSSTWMNGLSQFQIWVIEHDNTVELDHLLRPIKSRKTNAKAKVNCWQEVTSKRHDNPD
ncbi:hypothetical protein MAR_008530 [Mya arenaria]|uniref:Uncharacterized protein n=1 Tax=Mya arenaria TaxID=6604 RepID=A0ABY7DW92_MYAAR|nr:hypothetical protein MAR_008530 [Mya arenaria]